MTTETFLVGIIAAQSLLLVLGFITWKWQYERLYDITKMNLALADALIDLSRAQTTEDTNGQDH